MPELLLREYLLEILGLFSDDEAVTARIFMSLEHDAWPPAHEVSRLFPVRVVRPVISEEERGHPRFYPCGSLGGVFRDAEVAGDDNPIPLLAEGGYPLDVFHGRIELRPQMLDFDSLSLGKGTYSACVVRRHAVVEEEFHATSEFSYAIAARTDRIETS